MKIVKSTSSIVALACCLAMPVSALAQDEGQPDSGEEEAQSESAIGTIFVTAQRREQSLQEVPVSVTALGSEQIREVGFTNSLAIGDHVPNLEIKTFGGVPNIFIRGVGNNDFNSSSVSPIAVYRDDVVVASTGSQIFALFDMERIEVLRGPQGTLFGKNTTGGAIQFVSTLPGDYLEGYARIGYGRFNLHEAEAAASIPLAEDLSVRVAGLVRRRDGERTNLFTGEDAIDIDEAAVRAILRWRPGDAGADIRLSAGTGRDRSDYLQMKPVGTINGADANGYSDPFPDDISLLNFNGESRNFSDNSWVSLSATIPLSDSLTLKSVTGYDESSVDNRVDVDGSPLRLNEDFFFTDTEQFSQELQLQYEGESFNLLFGAFYFDEKLVAMSGADLVGELSFADGAVPLIIDAGRDNTSYALFGQGSYDLTEDLTLTGGLRYTWDEVTSEHRAYLVPNFFDDDLPNGDEIDLVPFDVLDDTFKAWSWRVALDYDVNDDVLIYGSVNRGFKSGTHNIGIITSLAERTTVQPETLTAYEVGLKSTLFDGTVRANLSAFYYDYVDLQVLSVNQQGSGIPTLGLDNAADATIKGIEGEFLAAPADGVDIGFNFGLLDATYQNYTSGAIDPVSGLPRDFSGNRLPGAPKFTMSTFARFEFPISDDFVGALRVEYNYTGNKFYNNGEDELVSSMGGYGLANIRATIAQDDGSWELAAWVRNMFDTDYIIDATDLRDLGYIPHYYGERRTWGVEALLTF